MKTAGSVLKSARLAKNLTLAQIEKATKIKVKILEKIESDQITKFSSFAHLAGLVQNYGEFLQLNTEYLTALLRRQVDFGANHSQPKFSLPKFWPFKVQLLAPLIFTAIAAYLVFQLASLKTGPRLEIFQPKPDSVVSLSKIQIQGVTDTEAQVTINGQKVPTNLQGEFVTEFELAPGVNLIEIVAKRGDGVERKVVRTVELVD